MTSPVHGVPGTSECCCRQRTQLSGNAKHGRPFDPLVLSILSHALKGETLYQLRKVEAGKKKGFGSVRCKGPLLNHFGRPTFSQHSRSWSLGKPLVLRWVPLPLNQSYPQGKFGYMPWKCPSSPKGKPLSRGFSGITKVHVPVCPFVGMTKQSESCVVFLALLLFSEDPAFIEFAVEGCPQTDIFAG